MMRVTQPMLAKGFLARSFDELKRRSSIGIDPYPGASRIAQPFCTVSSHRDRRDELPKFDSGQLTPAPPAWNLDAVKGPSGPRELYNFHSAESVSNCIVMADTLIGGSSTSHFDFVPATASSPTQTPASSAHGRFYGHISTSLPPDRLAIQRTGYAAFRTPDQPPTAFGRSVWDIDPYTYLALRVKSDGRAYYVNVQTESVEPTDLHQHRLFAKRPGQWETVLIRWNDFVRTNHGFVVEPQTELLRQKVHSVGIGLTDRVEGPFELCIERVWATNGADEKAAAHEGQQGELKNRKGENIQW